MEEKKDIAMQVKCVKCLKEQYWPAVYAISHWEHPCVWCGHTPEPMSEDDYWRAVNDRKFELELNN